MKMEKCIKCGSKKFKKGIIKICKSCGDTYSDTEAMKVIAKVVDDIDAQKNKKPISNNKSKINEQDEIGLVGLGVMILVAILFLMSDVRDGLNYDYSMVFWSIVCFGLSLYGICYLINKAQTQNKINEQNKISLVGFGVIILVVILYAMSDWVNGLNYNYSMVFWSTVCMGLSVYGVRYLTIVKGILKQEKFGKEVKNDNI